MACYNSVKESVGILGRHGVSDISTYNSSSYKELSGQEVLMPPLIKLLILKSFDSYNIFFKKSKTLFLYLQNAFFFVCSGCLKPRSTAGFNLSLISDVPYRFLLCIFSFWIIQRHDFFFPLWSIAGANFEDNQLSPDGRFLLLISPEVREGEQQGIIWPNSQSQLSANEPTRVYVKNGDPYCQPKRAANSLSFNFSSRGTPAVPSRRMAHSHIHFLFY